MVSRRAFFGMAAALAAVPLMPKVVIATEVAMPRPVMANSFKSIIPMIRKIMPGTIAQMIVGVQPMGGPAGLIYKLRFSYHRPFLERVFGFKRR